MIKILSLHVRELLLCWSFTICNNEIVYWRMLSLRLKGGVYSSRWGISSLSLILE